jgi:hypothetical protein
LTDSPILENSAVYDAQKPHHPPTYSWSEVWLMVLTRPSTETFNIILSDPQATYQRGFRWVFITGTIALIIQQLATYNALVEVYTRFNRKIPPDTLPIQLSCALFLGGFLVLISFIMGNGFTQAVARTMGGTGTFDRFFYASAAYGAPLIMTNVVVSAFGGVGGTAVIIASLVLSIYQLILTVMALKAVNEFSTGKAVLTIFLPTIIVVVVIGGFALLLGGAMLLPQATRS